MKVMPTIGFRMPREAASGAGQAPPLSGLVVWLDASDTSPSNIQNVSGSVSQWSDKSGLGNHATQEAGAAQPVTGSATINGKNAINFNGSKRINLPYTLYNLPAGGNTVFIVFKFNVVGDLQRILSGKNEGITNYGILPFTMITDYNVRNGGQATGTITFDTNPHISSLKRGGAALDAIYDGTIRATSALATNAMLTELTLGWDVLSSAAQGLNGLIGEVLIYNRALNVAEQNEAGRYLATKWGVTWTGI